MKAQAESQADRILKLLESANGEWVSLPRILGLYIANYRARLTELRRSGWPIELRDEWVNGQRQTAYRLAVKS